MLYYTYETFFAYVWGIFGLLLILWPDLAFQNLAVLPKASIKTFSLLSILSWLIHFVIPDTNHSSQLNWFALVFSLISLAALIGLRIPAHGPKPILNPRILPYVMDTIRESAVVFNSKLNVIHAGNSASVNCLFPNTGAPKNWLPHVPSQLVGIIKLKKTHKGTFDWNGKTFDYRFQQLKKAGYLLVISDSTKEYQLLQDLKDKTAELHNKQNLMRSIDHQIQLQNETKIRDDIFGKIEERLQYQLKDLQESLVANETPELLIQKTERSLKEIRTIAKNMRQQLGST